ncbi:uncharacterized protein LOC128240482 [Mya arenaria]|uniref:uncharacterized protein LOC128240482 n=1 Tax=Mya arenaria TaxID=6604 RepID=UPI0022DF1077|nr:uncharacterized protein LOC128240482 [Mya arenaria]
MASNFSSSTILKGSDLIHEYFCTPCKADNFSNEAKHFCEDCKIYFCDNCLNFHAKILQEHTVYGQQEFSKVGGHNEMCATHVKEVQAFCEDHQELCCSVCVTVNHSLCNKIRHILEVARGIHDKPEYKKLFDIITALQETLATVKHYENKHRHEILDARTRIREEFKSLRLEINKLLDDIQKTTLDQLNGIVTDFVHKVDGDISGCDQAHDSLKVFKEMLQSEKREKSSFIQYNKCLHEIKLAERIIHEMSTKSDQHLTFRPENNWRKIISKMKLFGKLGTKCAIKPYHTFKVVSQSRFNVKAIDDKTNCHVSGLCELPNGELLIVDLFNRKVKLLDTNYLLIAELSVTSDPISVCSIADNKAAVTVNNLWENKGNVNFYTINNGAIQLEKKFPMLHECISIAHHQGQLYVGSSQAIYLYTRNGEFVKKVFEDTLNVGVWSNRLAIGNNGKTLYVTNDNTDEIITLDNMGNKISTFKDPQLKSPVGIHVSASGHVFVCGMDSHTVMQVDSEVRQKLAVLAGSEDGLFFPRPVWFCTRTSSLILGEDASNKILVLKFD